MTPVWITAAKRTAVSPRGGAFRDIEPWQLAADVISALTAGMVIPSSLRREVIFGNALYAGGNPARMAALAAGLPEHVPALTIDTQCCSGLDAISVACSRIQAGQADVVIAGGMESYSRAPLRFRRPISKDEQPKPYARPPFSPWTDRDPDLIESAARLAADAQLTRARQEAFAIESHRKAIRAASSGSEILPIAGLMRDGFARKLSTKACERLPPIAGSAPYELTVAGVAVEADAAAAVVLTGEKALRAMEHGSEPVRILDSISRGFDPARPALAPIDAAIELLGRNHLGVDSLASVEIMEAFAVQAMRFIDDLSLNNAIVNRAGGALSRGHPIGASGAILAVRLFHELQAESVGARGLAAIAAAGGLGSAILLERA